MSVNCVLSVNKNGSIVGYSEGVRRVAANTYKIQSSDQPLKEYDVYIEDYYHKNYRCICLKYIFDGGCKHGEEALKFEQHIVEEKPAEYIQEQLRRIVKRLNISLD